MWEPPVHFPHIHVLKPRELSATRLSCTETSTTRFCVKSYLLYIFEVTCSFYMMLPDSSFIKENKHYPLLFFFHLTISRPSPLFPHSVISFPAVFPCPRLFSHFILFFKLQAITTCLPKSGLKFDFSLTRRKKYAATAELQDSFLL